VKIHWGDDDVYFGEVTAAELTPGGHGHGTFNINSSTVDIPPRTDNPFAGSNDNTATGELIRCVVGVLGEKGTQAGLTTFRIPRWGIRIHCEKLPDPLVYMYEWFCSSHASRPPNHDGTGHPGHNLVEPTFTLQSC